MNRPTRSCLALTLAMLAGSGQARAEVLTQEGAVKLALARHPLVQASGHDARAARERVRQAQTGWLPRVRLEGGYQYLGPQQRLTMTVQPDFLPDPIEINNEIGSVHNAQVGVSVAWRVYDFGARDVATQAARAAAAAVRAEGKEREAELAYAVRAAYLAALFFNEVERVTEAALGVAVKEQREEEIKKKAGVGSDLDLARVETRAAQLQSRLTEARQERLRALTTLRLLLGLGADQALGLADSLARLALTPAGPPPGRHPTRLRLEALKRASEHQLSAQWRSFWPTLDLMGAVKYQYPKNYFENDRAGLFYSAGLLLTWNLFDGDLLRRQRAETRARIRQVESLARASDEEVARQAADARARRQSAAAAAEAAARVRAAAAVYVKAARVSFRAGAGTALEVKKAEEASDQAELAERKAWFDAALAVAAELKALGVGARKEIP